MFTGDDDFNETSEIEMLESNHNVMINKCANNKTDKSPFRLRGELGVRIFFKNEDGDATERCIQINHHKGGIYLSEVII